MVVLTDGRCVVASIFYCAQRRGDIRLLIPADRGALRFQRDGGVLHPGHGTECFGDMPYAIAARHTADLEFSDLSTHAWKCKANFHAPKPDVARELPQNS